MTKKLAIAVAFALLTLTAPAHAATIDANDIINLNFGNGLIASGSIAFNQIHLNSPYLSFYPNPSVNLYLNGTPLPRFQNPFPPLGDPYYFVDPLDFGPPNSPGDFFAELAWPAGSLPTSVLDFTLNGRPAVSGDVTVTFTDELSPPSPVPLPAALPLFGSAVLGLAGFAASRSRRATRR
jgi:hypothetical protein